MDIIESLLEEAANLPTAELGPIKTLLGKGLAHGCLPGDMSALEATIAEKTKLPLAVVKALTKDLRNSKYESGCIHNLDLATSAYLDDLCKACDEAVSVNGDLYTFEHGSAEDEAFFVMHPKPDMLEHIGDYFSGMPVVRTAADRQEVLSGVIRRLNKPGFFDEPPMGVNVANGFVAWDAEANQPVLKAADPAQKARYKLAVHFDPAATAPHFTAALARTVDDPRSILAIQEMFGAILFDLSPRNDDARRVFILHGAPRSGKSTLIAVLQMLCGRATATVPPETWGQPYSRARLLNVKLNVCAELSAMKPLDGKHFKLIASCERVSARHPYGQEFELTPTARHVFAANELPRVTDQSEAFARRLVIINFDRTIEQNEVDGGILERMRDEQSGILNWAAEGGARLLAAGEFTLPAGQADGILQMRHGDDPLAMFVHERIERATGGRLRTSELKAALTAFALDIGANALDLTSSGMMNRLSTLMKKLFGARRSATNNQPYYENVRLKRRDDDGSVEPSFDPGLAGL